MGESAVGEREVAFTYRRGGVVPLRNGGEQSKITAGMRDGVCFSTRGTKT